MVRNVDHRAIAGFSGGGREDEKGWPNQGKVDIILDNLIAEGKAKLMLVVMDRGSAVDPNAPKNDKEPFMKRMIEGIKLWPMYLSKK